MHLDDSLCAANPKHHHMYRQIVLQKTGKINRGRIKDTHHTVRQRSSLTYPRFRPLHDIAGQPPQIQATATPTKQPQHTTDRTERRSNYFMQEAHLRSLSVPATSTSSPQLCHHCCRSMKERVLLVFLLYTERGN
ncbi:unnamed protein product [Vicia faba]|uniref:Uncharacterized protein n=1 Tax=Vicia faba TaxID=3906 RepID=A0AAV1BBK0_VICFA|nr:unnamed protein product [Vicia faba]